MALDPELVKALEEAAKQEKGLRQRGKTPPMAEAKKAGPGIGPDADSYDCEAGSG